MTRPLLALALCAALAAPAAAQSCSRALDRAETSYQSGDFDQTIDRLTACLDADAFSTTERRAAYRLIGLSYIGKDREADARAAVASLLEVAPTYEPDPALDPPPFVRLIAEVRRSRPALAEASGTRALTTAPGVAAAFRVHGMSYSDADDDSFTGAGGELEVAYGLTPSVAVFGRVAGSSGSGDGDLTLSLADVGVGGRFLIGGGQARLVPFVGAAAAFQSATFEIEGVGSVDYSGAGGEVEGGVLYLLSPSLALDAGLTARFTSIGDDVRPEDISATTLRLGVGLSWRP